MSRKWWKRLGLGVLVLAFTAGCGADDEAAAACGDGVCSDGEDFTTCPGDCERPAECIQQDEVVQAAVDEWHVTPNTVVAVRNEHCGMSTYANGDPAHATVDSLFLLASVTKTFVAAAIEQLADEQKLDLDDPMGNWIPDLEPIYDDVTVRMLLKHTSGLFSYNFASELWSSDQWTPEELLELGLSYDPYFAPGTDFHYSNTNYIALGLILEAVEDKALGEVLRERALEPAGLEYTFFGPEEEIVGDMATRFDVDTGAEIEEPIDMFRLWAAGGMVADAADTAHWMWELYGARSIVDAATVDEMIDDSVAAPEDAWALEADYNYGHGTCITLLADTNCGYGVGHNGRWYRGGSMDAFYFEDCSTAVAVMQNRMVDDPGDPTQGAELVLVKVLQALFP